VKRGLPVWLEVVTAAGQLLKQLPGVLATPSTALVYTQALFGVAPWAILSVFFLDFLVHDKGFAPDVAALLLLTFGVGAVVGGILGGYGGSCLYVRAGPAVALFATGVAQASASPPMLFILFRKPQSLTGWEALLFAVVACVGGLCSSFAGPNIAQY
jgi:predicted MFS family arabinose efflux permease